MKIRKRLGDMLLEAGLIDRAQLDTALGYQRRWGGRIGSILITLNLIQEEEILDLIGKQCQVPCVVLSKLQEPPTALSLFPLELAKKYTVFPILHSGKAITLAMMDPTDLEVLKEIEFRTEHRMKPVLALESEIRRAIRRFYEGEALEGVEYRVDVAAWAKGSGVVSKIDGVQKDSPGELMQQALLQLLIERGLISQEELDRKMEEMVHRQERNLR